MAPLIVVDHAKQRSTLEFLHAVGVDVQAKDVVLQHPAFMQLAAVSQRLAADNKSLRRLLRDARDSLAALTSADASK